MKPRHAKFGNALIALLPSLSWSLPGRAAAQASPMDAAASLTIVQLAVSLGVAVALIVGLLVLAMRRERQLRDTRKTLVEALHDPYWILSNLSDLVWMKDLSGTYLACNPAMGALHGAKARDVIGRTDFDFMPIEQARRNRKADRAAIEGGETRETNDWFTFAEDGRSAYLQIRRSPIYDDQGQLLGVLGVGRDISDLHRAEVEVQQRDIYQRALIDNFPFSVWLKDTDSRFLAVNQKFAETAGFDLPTELTNKTDFDIWPQALAETYRRDDRRVLSRRVQIEAQEVIEKKGERWQMETYKAPVIDDVGNLLGTVGFARDVTEKHKVEQALRNSEQRFRDFFDRHSAILMFIDPGNGEIVDANQAAADFYGYERAVLIGMPISAINTASQAEIALSRQQVVDGEKTHFEFKHRLADGELRDVDEHSVAVVTDDRPLLLSIIVDMTERNRVEQKITYERDLFSAGPVVVFEWGAGDSYPVDYVSGNVCALLGYSKQEMETVGCRYADIIHPEDLPTIDEEHRRYRAKGIDEFERSYRIRHKSGDYRWVMEYAKLLRDARGDVVGTRGYLFDQTQTKTLQLTLSNERRRLQSIIEGTRVGTWEWNVQTGETRFNERWAEIIGYTLDELRPLSIETWLSFAHPKELEASRRLLKEHFEGRLDYYELEARMKHKSGEWVWVLDRGQVFEWTDDGKPLWMAGTHQDISEHKRNALAHEDNERRLSAAGKSAYDLIYERDSQQNTLTWFGDIDASLGYQPGEIEHSIEDWLSRIHPDDRPLLLQALEQHTNSSEPYEYGYRVLHRDGRYRYWQDKGAPVCDEQGHILKWVGSCTDVTEKRRAEEQQRLAATVFAHAHEGIMIADASANIIEVNQAFTAITGYSRHEVIGKNPRMLRSGRQDENFYRDMWRDLTEKGHWAGEVWNRRKDGCAYAENLSISAVHDNRGIVQHYVALFADITQQKEDRQQLEHIAYFDALTGLPNRMLLGDRLLQAMSQSERHDRMLAVVYLDLDGFKEVNDRYGHDVGDQLLIDVAGRLKEVLRGEDTVSRLGGDEFVAVLVDLDDAADCVELLPRMLAAAAQPLRRDGQEVSLSASLGVTFYPQADVIDADHLLRQADQAMYQAKLAGKNRYHVFDAEQDRSIRGQVEKLEEIRLALAADEFTLHYQPKVNMRTGDVIGAEALIRWPQPDGRMLMPADFLPILENHSLAITLDEWVFDQALSQLERWHASGLEIDVSVNVSAHHLQQTDFTERLHALLDRHPKADPGHLVVEILETTALMDLERISGVIHAGQALGVVFALDDFGTGYSSLNYLKSLPAKQLKIDRSFVRDMLDDRDDLAILDGIMGLAAAFGREPVAEGVENVEHGEILLQLGCELAQGFGIGRPMPADHLTVWASSWRPDPVWQRQQRVGHDDLPLVFAMVEHRTWVKAITDRVSGERVATPTMDEALCQFSQWMNRDGNGRYGQRDEFREVRALHHQIHVLAPEVLQLHASERHEETLLKLQALHQLRDRLLYQLKMLLKHTEQRLTGTC